MEPLSSSFTGHPKSVEPGTSLAGNTGYLVFCLVIGRHGDLAEGGVMMCNDPGILKYLRHIPSV